jgi:hypothetical protein
MESTLKANLRSSPWVIMAWAIMNAPIKRKIVSEAKAPKTLLAEATPKSTHIARASTAVTGMGIGSVSQ